MVKRAPVVPDLARPGDRGVAVGVPAVLASSTRGEVRPGRVAEDHPDEPEASSAGQVVSPPVGGPEPAGRVKRVRLEDLRFSPPPECPTCDGLGFDLARRAPDGGPARCPDCSGMGTPGLVPPADERCGDCGYLLAARGHRYACGGGA